MAQKIRTSIIVILTILNFIGVISIFYCISLYKIIPNNSIRNISKVNKNNYINENELESSKIINSTENMKSKLLYKKLSSYSSSFYYNSIILMNLIFLCFCFNLIISFAIGDSECCNCCSGGCRDCNCDCNSNNGDSGSIIICLLMIFILLIIFYLNKLCGKHLSRYISLSFITIINFFIIIISLIHLNEDPKSIQYTILISTILFLCNSLGLILPNLKKCEKLRYKSKSLPIINYPQDPISQISTSNGYTENNNYSKNAIPKGNSALDVPIVYNEYNAQTNNASISSSVNTLNSNSGNLGNQQLMSSGNLGIPPLPTEEVTSEKEIYSEKPKE